MIKQWILIFLLLLGIAQTGFAQPVKKQKTRHPATHTSTKHISKTKANTRHSNNSSHTKNKISKKPLHSHNIAYNHGSAAISNSPITIPQAQFDLADAMNPANNASNNANNVTDHSSTDDSLAAIDTSSEKLTALAYQTVESAHYSSYRFGGTTFDTAKGIYQIDCSTYVNDLLSKTNPLAYSSLVSHTQTTKPTTTDYYNFFKRLPEQGTQYWHKVAQVEQLGPGGILVFLNKRLHSNRTSGGHMMVVMSNPIPENNSDTYQVKVADSASSGHSFDTRSPHKSGIGIGTLLLKVDHNTRQLKAYAWRLDDHWRSNITFAMATPYTNSFN